MNTSLENNTFTYSNSKQNSIHDYYNNDDSDVNFTDDCFYYDDININSCKYIHNSFSIIHINARSLVRNHDQINLFLNSIIHKFSIIIITETWLKHSNQNIYNFDNYNQINTIRSVGRGGGVAIFILNSLSYTIINDLNISISHFIEITTISLKFNNINYIISGIYKTPTADIKQFSDFIVNSFEKLASNCNRLYLCGDFNINLLDHNYNKHVKYFIDSIYSLGCRPLIDKPTRVTNDNNSLIDNIFTNNNYSHKYNGILLNDISDHYPIFTFFDLNVNNSNEKQTKSNSKINRVNNSTIKELKNCILHHKWDFSDMDTNTAFNYFIDMFKLMLNKCCPLYTPKIINNKIKNPWINNSLLKCIHHKKNY